MKSSNLHLKGVPPPHPPAPSQVENGCVLQDRIRPYTEDTRQFLVHVCYDLMMLGADWKPGGGGSACKTQLSSNSSCLGHSPAPAHLAWRENGVFFPPQLLHLPLEASVASEGRIQTGHHGVLESPGLEEEAGLERDPEPGLCLQRRLPAAWSAFSPFPYSAPPH